MLGPQHRGDPNRRGGIKTNVGIKIKTSLFLTITSSSKFIDQTLILFPTATMQYSRQRTFFLKTFFNNLLSRRFFNPIYFCVFSVFDPDPGNDGQTEDYQQTAGRHF